MRYIVIIMILLISIVNAADDDFKFTGKIEAHYVKYKAEKNNGDQKNNTSLYNSLLLNLSYNYNNFHFQLSPMVYYFDSKDDLKAKTRYKPFNDKDFFFKSFYMSYTIENITMGIGVLPFSDAFPRKYSGEGYQNGVGLNPINDNDLTSIFFQFKSLNSTTVFALSTLDDILVPTGDYIEESLTEDTMVYSIINDYKVDDKINMITELMYIDMKYEGKDLSEIMLCGIGLSWDDSMHSGFIFYNVLSGSIYKNKSTSAESEIYNNLFSDNSYGLTPEQMGRYLNNTYPNSFAINDDYLYGASNLFGIRYELDYFPIDTFINVEWFHTIGDWTSGNQGNPYTTKYNQIWNIRDNSYYIEVGMIPFKNTTVRASYTYMEYEEVGKIGAPADTINPDEFLGGRPVIIKDQMIHLIFTFRF